jgi:hypothetical protein
MEQGSVPRRKLVPSEMFSRNPLKRCVSRAGGPGGGATGDEDQLDAIVRVVLDLLRITKERLDQDAGFFAAFANSSLFGRFPGLDFSSGELPQAGEGHASGALADEKAAFVLDDGDRDGSRHAVQNRDYRRGYDLY